MSQGMTLIELVVAIGVWSILIFGAAQILMHTTQSSVDIISSQSAHENARAAIDALTVNIQMADEIILQTHADGMLRHLITYQLNPNRVRTYYTFSYDAFAPPNAARFRVLQYSRNNELASDITEVRLRLSDSGYFIYITVTADNEITLTGAVDIRYKELTVR